jgi:signal peptidase I
MVTLLLFFAFIVVVLLVQALGYWFGGYLVARKGTFGRGLLVALAALLLNGLLAAGVAWGQSRLASESMVVPLLIDVVALLVSLWVLARVIAWLFSISFPRALVVWVIGLAGPAVSLLFLYLVQPYVFASYIVPTNPMVPTVVGWHTTQVCPHCQGVLFVPAEPPGQRQLSGSRPGICAACRQVSEVTSSDPPSEDRDRILVNKVLSVRRWDVVVYVYPQREMDIAGPQRGPIKTVGRVVGLPGETVYLKDGGLWVNDAHVEFPPEMAGQQYLSGLLYGSWGIPENPWRLGPNEYALLGDFSARSSDSRDWGVLPATEIEGVVGAIYWPPARWKLFR